MKYRTFCILFFSVCILSCSGKKESEFNTAEVRQAIGATDAEWSEAMTKGDIPAVGKFYTDDALLLPPDELIIIGKQGIENYYSTMKKAGEKIISMETNTADVGGSGDIAFETGTLLMTTQIGSKPASTDSEKYTSVWKHQADGSWKIRVSTWNRMMKK
jgi:uncharacterized protein (TIGR02246 family)